VEKQQVEVNMVQIIPAPRSRITEKLIDKDMSPAFESFFSSIMNEQKQEKMQQQQQAENEAFKDQFGIDLSKYQDKETRQEIMKYALQGDLEEIKQNSKYGAKAKALKGLFNRQGQGQDFSNEIMQEHDMPEERNLPSFLDEENPRQMKKNVPQRTLKEPSRPNKSQNMPYSQEQIDQALAMGEAPIAARMQADNKSAQDNQNRQEDIGRKNKEISRKEEIQFHGESEEYDKELLKNVKSAKKQIETLNNIESVAGKVKPGSWTNVFSYFGDLGKRVSNAILTEDEATLMSSIPQLLEGWKEVFGVRLSDADLKILEDKLPSIQKSPEANMAVVKILKKYAKQNLLRYEIGKEIKDKNKGIRPLGYVDQIEKRFDEMTQQVQVRSPRGNIVEMPAYMVGDAIKNGGALVNE
jgi:hypothetical protein